VRRAACESPRPWWLALLFVPLAALPWAQAIAVEYRASSYVFGTLARITVIDEDLGRARNSAQRVLREFDRMHRDLHAWQPGELVKLNRAIARGKTNIRTTPEIATLIREARRLGEKSGGLFNPAIGKLVGLWSFHRNKPGGRVPDAGEISRIVAARPRMSDLSVQDNSVTSVNRAVQLDFGGYAKGYALDRAAGLLHMNGISNALIDIGGNIMALGDHSGHVWRIGIESPRHQDMMAMIELHDGEAIGTSGDYRRYYEIDGKRYAHIIDPRTGYPVSGVESVTVLVPAQARAGALSDAASKPLFIEGRAGWRRAATRMGIAAAMLVDSDGRVHLTRAMRERLLVGPQGPAIEIVP